MLICTLSSKGQVTAPRQIREFLHIATNDTDVSIPQEDGSVTITTERHSASSMPGMLKHRKLKKPVSAQEMEKAIKKR